MNRLIASILLAIVTTVSSLTAQALDFSDLWLTGEQRAARQLEAQRFEALIEQAPNERWRGLGHYGAGDYEAAASAFEAGAQATDRTVDDLYNQATALTRLGDYDRAIDLLDQVLAEQPDAQDARQNRAIAESLRELARQPQQAPQNGQGESGDGAETGDSAESQANSEARQGDESSTDAQSGDSNARQQASDSGSSSAGSSPDAADSTAGRSAQRGDGEPDGDQRDSEDDAQASSGAQTDEAALQEAADALASGAEQQDEADGASDDGSQEGGTGNRSQDPMSEVDQATEQWLRRIPDDPAGLLRRKLEQSHRNDYPEVGDAQRAW